MQINAYKVMGLLVEAYGEAAESASGAAWLGRCSAAVALAFAATAVYKASTFLDLAARALRRLHQDDDADDLIELLVDPLLPFDADGDQQPRLEALFLINHAITTREHAGVASMLCSRGRDYVDAWPSAGSSLTIPVGRGLLALVEARVQMAALLTDCDGDGGSLDSQVKTLEETLSNVVDGLGVLGRIKVPAGDQLLAVYATLRRVVTALLVARFGLGAVVPPVGSDDKCLVGDAEALQHVASLYHLVADLVSQGQGWEADLGDRTSGNAFGRMEQARVDALLQAASALFRGWRGGAFDGDEDNLGERCESFLQEAADAATSSAPFGVAVAKQCSALAVVAYKAQAFDAATRLAQIGEQAIPSGFSDLASKLTALKVRRSIL